VVTEEEEVDPHSTFKMDGEWPKHLRSCATHLKYIQYVLQYRNLINHSYRPRRWMSIMFLSNFYFVEHLDLMVCCA
jgi:hypothetical protein